MLNRSSYGAVFGAGCQRAIFLMGLCGLLGFVASCPGTGGGPRGQGLHARQESAANPAVSALRAGQFGEAEKLARRALSSDERNPQARLVAALSTYILDSDRLFPDLKKVLDSASHRAINYDFLRITLTQIEKSLEKIDADLAVASQSPDVTLELCPACWKADWNHNGAADAGDERLLEVEFDAAGRDIPEGDPRRRPTFRFDIGDVFWARAMIAFQLSGVELLLSYQLSDLGVDLEATVRRLVGQQGQLTIHLTDKRRVVRARELIISGVAQAERARKEYLAETDDDREWVPSPRQKNHPLPLPVDDALYETWAGMLDDLRKLVAGEEGISAREALELSGVRVLIRPSGYLSLRTLLFEPKDLVLSAPDLANTLLRPDTALRSVFGDAYVESLPASRLLSRLIRMREEVQRGDETIGHKLRYLFWLN
jgi:hypothetical protein